MLISSDTILRQYIPNVFATASGEQSLYEKLRIELQLSEQWLTTHVLSDTILNQLTTTNSLEDTSSAVTDTTQTTTGDADASSAVIDTTQTTTGDAGASPAVTDTTQTTTGDAGASPAVNDTTQTTAQPTNVSAANQQRETTNVQLKTLASRAIVSDAFVRAIPSLDLVLTPNGFGIVSNQNVVPASSERVERLIQSLITNRDLAIDSLLNHLLQNADWRATPQAQYFLATLFPTLSSLTSQLSTTPSTKSTKTAQTTLSLWDKYTSLHSPLILIEQELADKFISPELYARLRNTPNTTTTQTTAQSTIVTNTQSQTLISLLRSIELMLLQGNPLPYNQLISIVDYIRNRPDTFPEWQTSATAQRYQPHAFENTKSSSGYWF